MNTHRHSTRSILLIEDSQEDLAAFQRALKRLADAPTLFHTFSGEEALQWLHRQAEQTPSHLPDLIVLDLNLPDYSGHVMLQILKNDMLLRTIPVIVMSVSTNERDIQAAYQSGANTYINKPVDLQRFYTIVGTLCEYWFNIARLV